MGEVLFFLFLYVDIWYMFCFLHQNGWCWYFFYFINVLLHSTALSYVWWVIYFVFSPL